MSTSSLHHSTVQRRALRTRKAISANRSVPRLSVHRSLRHIHAQIIDDMQGITLVAINDASLTLAKDVTKTDIAKLVGAEIAKLALTKKITNVRFDRGSYRYHGRVAALAEAAREAGLVF